MTLSDPPSTLDDLMEMTASDTYYAILDGRLDVSLFTLWVEDVAEFAGRCNN